MTLSPWKWRKPTLRIPTFNELCRRSHKGFHTAYFAAAAVEGHGLYALTAGSLLALAILDFFLHFE
ncbi:hypothetical protein [Rhizobium favelukesii]|uniref:Uncharacterized protein n=1 Tax=Rhizobium favelukesii TaxID=348824 RepID=W6R902_9HYPH|nr:hypothetical protein [Rhizobium favelukesii]MCS0459301.1 hypothetical protein [Rhizobium favelukesii]CDM57399.1 putative predicted protein [Rhizobium favelukesii]